MRRNFADPDQPAPPQQSSRAADNVRANAREPLAHPPGTRTDQFVRSDRREASAHSNTSKRVLYCIAWPLLLGIALLVILVVVLQMPAVHQKLMKSMRLVHTDDGWGMPMDYDRISGVFPWRFTMHNMRVVDPTGRGFSAQEAEVRTSLWTQLHSQAIIVDSVVLRDTATTEGDGYVEDNTHINTVEHSATDDWAARNAREKTWPNLPRGLIISSLRIESLFVQPLNRTISVTGSINLQPEAGNFNVNMTVSDDRSNTLALVADGSKSTRRVSLKVQLSNTTELCDSLPEVCARTVNVAAVFPSQVESLRLAGALTLAVDVSGTYGGFLQAAFPSKHHMSVTDLIAGTIALRIHEARPLVSEVITTFRINGNRTVFVEEARIVTPLLAHQRAPFIVRGSFMMAPKALPQFLTFEIPEQRLVLPSPLNEYDVRFMLESNLNGDVLMRKRDTAGNTQWSLTSRFVYTETNTSFGVSLIEVCANLPPTNNNNNSIQGSADITYTPLIGVHALVELTDVERELIARAQVDPYVMSDGRQTHSLVVVMKERSAQLGKMQLTDLRLTALIDDVPFAPHGTLDMAFGRVDYDSGVFVMNNASVEAVRAVAGPLDTTPWQLTATSSTDLNTRFTMMLVGNGENEFRGSVSPFEATLYNTHKVWTSDVTRLAFNYQKQDFSLSCALHANEVEPERVSLDIDLDGEKLRLLVNDASYLLDPVLFKPRVKTTGLLQGYVEIVQPLGAVPHLGAVDMCWNDGAAVDAAGTQLVHNAHGCLRGNFATGWSINYPPATFVLDYPRLGECEMVANVSATKHSSETGISSVLDLPVQLKLRMLDVDASRLFESAWIELDAQVSLKL